MCRQMLKNKIMVLGFITSLSGQHIVYHHRLSLIIHTSLFRALSLYFLQMGDSSCYVIVLLI